MCHECIFLELRNTTEFFPTENTEYFPTENTGVFPTENTITAQILSH